MTPWTCLSCRQPYGEGYSLYPCGFWHQFRPIIWGCDVPTPILDHTVPRKAMLLATWRAMYMRGLLSERKN